MNDFSDSLVKDYDLFGKIFPSHDELQQALADAIQDYFSDRGFKSGDLTLLDIGAGYGFSTKLVMQHLPNARYILNEYDEVLLSHADKYLEGHKFNKQKGDIEEVIKTIPDESIDGVYSAWVLHNFPKPKREVVIKEIARILKPKGIFAALDKVEDPGPQRLAHLSRALIGLEPFYTKYNRPDLYLEWVRHYLRDETPELMYTDKEQESRLKSYGFSWKYGKQLLFDKITVAIKQ